MPSRDELEELLLDICPSYQIRKDRKGQLIIYTGLTEDEYGELLDGEEEVDDDAFESDDEELVAVEEDEDDQ